MPFAQGAQLGAETVNKEGGIKAMEGAQIDVTTSDDKSDPEAARQGALDLTGSDGVSAIVGPDGSGTCLGAAPVAEQNQVPLLCSGTDPTITSEGYEFVYNVGTLSIAFSETLIRFLEEVNKGGEEITKIGIIHEDGPYGSTFGEQLSSLAPKAGFEVVSNLSFSAGDPNLKPLVTRAADAGAQLLFVGSFSPDVITALKAVTTLDSNMLVASISGSVLVPTVAELGDVSNGVLAIANWNIAMNNRPDLASFTKEYEAEFGEAPTADAATGYMAMKSVAAALEQAQSSEPADIKAALDEVEAEIGITPAPKINYDEEGLLQPQEETTVVAQLQNGKFETIYPAEVATGKFKAK